MMSDSLVRSLAEAGIDPGEGVTDENYPDHKQTAKLIGYEIVEIDSDGHGAVQLFLKGKQRRLANPSESALFAGEHPQEIENGFAGSAESEHFVCFLRFYVWNGKKCADRTPTGRKRYLTMPIDP